MTGPLYWTGNAAKVAVANTILERAAGRPVTVLDHGCGDGGSWPEVLRDHSNVKLLVWDADPRAVVHARRALAGLDATVCDDFPEGRADFVVSFSVLEHVRDRPKYLAQARCALADSGVFFLNYDDGHFRHRFDIDDRPRAWLATGRRAITHALHRARRRGPYERRVSGVEIESLLADAGLSIRSSRYHNLEAFKWLAKHAVDDQAFARLWAELEEQLNETPFRPADLRDGDDAALWRVCLSRTLELVPVPKRKSDTGVIDPD